MTRILPIAEVSRVTSLSPRTIYRMMSDGRFPSARKVSHQKVGWRSDEVSDWIEALPTVEDSKESDPARPEPDRV